MTKQMGFYIDTDRCTACKACEIACKNRNKLGVGPRLRQVHQIISGDYPDLKITNVSMGCMHCEKPACMAVCPVGAISKRAQDGIVVVDRSICIGCHACAQACPFGVPQYDADGTMVKCDYCLEFQEIGKGPACAENCMYEALHWGTMEELTEMVREKAAERMVAATKPSGFIKA